MEDLLSFVNEIVKRNNEMTMRELVSMSGMTRSKFYRYMKEPWRFSKEQMDNIEQYLHLSGKEKEIFDQFYSSHEEKRLKQGNHFLGQLLFNSWPIESDFQSKLYTLFDSTTPDNKVSRLSSREVAETLRQWVERQDLPHEGHFLNFRIVNCLHSDKIKLIYSLLISLQELDIFSNYNLLPRHIIDSSKMSLEDKLHSIRTSNSLYNLNNYTVDYVPLKGEMWSGVDFCLAEYSYRDQQKLFISMIFPSSFDALVFFSSDRLLFDYITYNSEKIFKFDAKSAFAPNEPIALNRFLIQATLTYQKIIICQELCYDCFCTELWQEVKAFLKQNNEMIQGLRHFADPRDELSPFSDAQFVDYLFESCIQRYLVSESNRVINIISSSGLKQFAYTGSTCDFDSFNLRLTDTQIIYELQNIRERLGDHTSERKQSYLIISPTCGVHYEVFEIYRNYLFAYYLKEDHHTTGPLTTGFTQQPEMATALYDYIIGEILPNNRRQAFDSPVMSDEQATKFVDSLIKSVKIRMDNKKDL